MKIRIVRKDLIKFIILVSHMNAHELVGRTITNAKVQKLSKHDEAGYVVLNFSDGSECFVEASFGTYTGNSLSEYPTLITLSDKFISTDGETLVDA